MYLSHVSPVVIAFLLFWLSCPCHGQYDPFGGPPYYGEPDPYRPYFTPPLQPEGPLPQAPPPQAFYPPPNLNFNNNANLFNPFLPTGQQSQTQQAQQQQQQLLQQQQQLQQLQQQQQQQLQQLQGSYPNLPSVPFQTVSPGGGNNPLHRIDKYPFHSGTTFGNVGTNNNNNINPLNNLQQQQTFGNTLLNQQQYPKLPDLPFQTITPGQYPSPSIGPLINGINPQLNPYKPRIELPKIRVIEFPSSEYFEYGGGKLVQPKRANSDLYIGGSGGDVPITSKVFIECTGPNQVEWILNGTSEKKGLSVVTKNFQITIPEERGPTPGSREYTYLRLGLEEQITEKDSGVYICRDRILPQNYISIRALVAKSSSSGGKPNYPFIRPKDPNTIYYSQRDRTIVLPCKIENADATISLHKHENGKLSCPYTLDGRVTYDRFKGFIVQTQSFSRKDLEGRYVCVGDFAGDLRLMKYKVVNSEDFTTRFVEGDTQNVITLDGQKKSGDPATASSSTFLAQVDPFPDPFSSGLSNINLTAAGLVDPRSEFDIVEADEASYPTTTANPTNKVNKNKTYDSKAKL